MEAVFVKKHISEEIGEYLLKFMEQLQMKQMF